MDRGLEKTRFRFNLFSYWISWSTIRIFGWLWLRLKIEGTENIPRKGPLLIVSNHASHLDPPIIGCACPRPIRYLAKSELFATPGLNFLMRSWGQVPVYRESRSSLYSAVRVALELLKSGEAVAVFPEGTRSHDGIFHPGRTKTGASVIALESGATVLPASIVGSYEALPVGSHFPRRVQVTVRFGKVLDLSKYKGQIITRDLAQDVAQVINHEIAALLPDRMKAMDEGDAPAADEEEPEARPGLHREPL